ncbi:MAG: biopolymer transporter ExbD, partial [Caldilineaceae bacterium]|nr:biopolymer transporter ExbD [Caldilineaceae bacterium]
MGRSLRARPASARTRSAVVRHQPPANSQQPIANSQQPIASMKLSARKLERGRKVELQMTSMIDVVFLLLIFFMV